MILHAMHSRSRIAHFGAASAFRSHVGSCEPGSNEVGCDHPSSLGMWASLRAPRGRLAAKIAGGAAPPPQQKKRPRQLEPEQTPQKRPRQQGLGTPTPTPNKKRNRQATPAHEGLRPSPSKVARRTLWAAAQRSPAPHAGGGAAKPAGKALRTKLLEAGLTAALSSPAGESEIAHFLRHPRSDPTWMSRCDVCVFYRDRSFYEKSCAMDARATSRGQPLTCLAVRPAAYGGEFALGCCVCAAALAERPVGEQPRNRNRRRNVKWARYEVNVWRRKPEWLARVGAHLASDNHKANVQALFSKEAHMAKLAPVVGPGDAVGEVFRGKVPQPLDWMDVWASTTSAIAFRKQDRLEDKLNPPDRRKKLLRRTRTKMVGRMAEAVRAGQRKSIREATTMSIAVDERRRKKILRFRADAPDPPYVVNGVLGVLGGAVASPGEAQKDHAQKGVESMEAFLRRFCTTGGAFDQALFDHALAITRVLASDGASSQRREIFAQSRALFPAVALAVRDPGHAVRIACEKPLLNDTLFARVRTELFDKKHAIVPGIQNSPKWRAILEAYQVECGRLQIPGEASPMKTVLRHLSFAKQRWESAADPQAKLVLMLLPVCCLLALKASDQRHGREDRERCQAASPRKWWRPA